MMTTKKALVNVALLFYVFLVLARVVDNDILGSWENTRISQGLWGSWIWVAIKFSYWCLPVLIYLALQGRLAKYLRGTFGFRIKWSYALALIPLWFLVLLLEDHLVIPAPDLTYFHLVTSVVTTPIIEEFVFRGFILDTLSERLSFSRTNLYQAVLFSCIHLPYYYELGRFNNAPLLVGNLLYLGVFGYAAGYLARRTMSLYPSVLLHAINNLLTLPLI